MTLTHGGITTGGAKGRPKGGKMHKTGGKSKKGSKKKASKKKASKKKKGSKKGSKKKVSSSH
jgi:hypothetical protein